MNWLKRLFFGVAWRLYQIALIAAGLLAFRYWIFEDMMNSDKLPSLVVTDVFGSLLFAYVMTILTTRCLDYFRSGNKPPQQDSSVAIAPEEGRSNARRRLYRSRSFWR